LPGDLATFERDIDRDKDLLPAGSVREFDADLGPVLFERQPGGRRRKTVPVDVELDVPLNPPAADFLDVHIEERLNGSVLERLLDLIGARALVDLVLHLLHQILESTLRIRPEIDRPLRALAPGQPEEHALVVGAEADARATGSREDLRADL